MIRFTLICDSNHDFEAWFGNNADFDSQRDRGLVECPFCGSLKIEKALMTPSVARSSNVAPVKPERPQSVDQADSQDKNQTVSHGVPSPEALSKLHDMVRQIRASSENVGKNFTREARDIHDGIKPDRPIIGEASGDEIKALIEDDIPVAPLPTLPEDQN